MGVSRAHIEEMDECVVHPCVGLECVWMDVTSVRMKVR